MNTLSTFYFWISLACSLNSSLFAQNLEFKSEQTQTHLLELFSSEGCSSCPPADHFLAKLKTHPKLWENFVPIEFHVDYWNRLGWVDRLSKESFTARQKQYAKEWSQTSIGTPAFVLDGMKWNIGNGFFSTSDFDQKRRDLVGILRVIQKAPFEFEVSFAPISPIKSVMVYAALLGNGLKSEVTSGENVGLTLNHEFVVLYITQKKMDHKKSHFESKVELVPPSNEKATSYSLAVWVTLEEQLKPIQAVGGNLTHEARIGEKKDEAK